MSQDSQSVLGAVVRKEVHDLVLTLRFTVGTALTLLLALLAAYVGSIDYNARLDSYQTKLKLNRDDLVKTTVYSFLRPTLVRPPEPLSILNHGLEGRLGTDVFISVDQVNTEARGENRGNEYLSIFSELDLTVIVEVILGLLALLFTFDSVCGEREAGMLKLIMSYPISRSKLLLGKYLGSWITLMLPAALACLLSLVVIGLVADVSFHVSDMGRVVLILAFYGIYLSLMLLAGLVISSFFQRSSIALVVSTFVWFFFVTIVPNLATMIPDFVGNRASVYQTAQENLKQTNKQENDTESKLKDPRDCNTPKCLWYYAINNNWGGITAFECHFGDDKFYNQVTSYFEQRIPLAERFAAQRADIWRQYLRYRQRQAHLARGLAFLSPSAVFENIEGYLSGTSDADYSHFMTLATQYRDTFLAYLNGKNAFSSWRWYTTDPEDGDKPWTVMATGKSADEMAATSEDPMQVLNNWSKDPARWASFIKIEQERGNNTSIRLPLDDLPAYFYQRLATSEILVNAAPEVAYLLALNLILFFAAFMRFAKYDVR